VSAEYSQSERPLKSEVNLGTRAQVAARGRPA
jgi:hypothetical protein